MNFGKFSKIVSLALIICITVLLGVYSANYVINKDNNPEDLGTEKIKGKRINILLLATDKGGMLTDTIMVASFDKERKMVNVLSIPRDTRIRAGNSYAKINAAYGMGTEGKRQEFVIKKITEITGLPINYYMLVDPKGFRNIIDILGGVEIDVPQRMYYVDPTQDLVINLKPGLQVLDGSKAEQFCRYRSGYADADLGRISAQQMFIKELFKQKLKPQYISKAGDIFSEISENVKTNIGIDDALKLLPLVKLMNSESLNTYRLPGEASMIGDASYYLYDREETDKLINEVFLNNVTETTQTDITKN